MQVEKISILQDKNLKLVYTQEYSHYLFLKFTIWEKEMVKSFEKISKMLKEALSINAARAKTLTLIIFAMINCETVNLSKLSKHLKTDVKQASSYKRLQRFMKEVSFKATKLGRVLLAFADVGANEKLKLILDRTNWKFGENYINILCLSVVTPNGNFPLFWSMIKDKKQGSSDHIDRIDLIEQFIKCFGKDRIECVIGDSEFIGKNWIEWLKGEKIEYVMCLRNSQNITSSKGGNAKGSDFFRGLKPGTFLNLGERKINKDESYSAYIVGIRTKDGGLIIIACSANIKDGSAIYKLRWGIETLFKSLKTGGFHLEDTHIIDPYRLEVLLSVVAISYTIASKFGGDILKVTNIRLKNHGYKVKSTIRMGIDRIIFLLNNFSKKFHIVVTLIKKSLAPYRRVSKQPIQEFVL